MAPTAPLRLTPLAQLLDITLTAKRSQSLATYLAIARTPGPAWQTYDQITADLIQLTGRDLNRVSIKTFAEKLIGLPDTRYLTIGGKPKAMPAPVPADTLDAYLSALPGSVDVSDVRAHAAEAHAAAAQAQQDVTRAQAAAAQAQADQYAADGHPLLAAERAATAGTLTAQAESIVGMRVFGRPLDRD